MDALDYQDYDFAAALETQIFRDYVGERIVLYHDIIANLIDPDHPAGIDDTITALENALFPSSSSSSSSSVSDEDEYTDYCVFWTMERICKISAVIPSPH